MLDPGEAPGVRSVIEDLARAEPGRNASSFSRSGRSIAAAMDRRAFLRYAGRTALGAAGLTFLGAACGNAPGAPRATDPAFLGAASATDWEAFGRSFAGRLIRPGDARYNQARKLFDPRFDVVHPSAIAICRGPADVQQSIQFARGHGLDFAARSGGHSYAGYSTTDGLVCDLGGLSAVTVNPAAKTATVGAGAHLIDVYAALAQHGMALPGGSCPTVGVSGLTLGRRPGGAGAEVRPDLGQPPFPQDRHGGRRPAHVRRPAQRRPVLGLPRRGRGQLRRRHLVHVRRAPGREPGPVLLRMAVGRGARRPAGWQGWAPHAPDALWSNCHLRAGAGQPAVSVSGVFVGTEAGLLTQVNHLIQAVGSQPSTKDVTSESLLGTMMLEAGCSDLTRGPVPPAESEPGRRAPAPDRKGEVRLLRPRPAGGQGSRR